VRLPLRSWTRPASPSKRHVTGRGNADKAAVIAAVRARGFHPADDNEADALAILLWANAHGAVAPNGNYSGAKSAIPPPFSKTASDATGTPFALILESATIHVVANTSASLYCAGWVDNL